MVSTNRISYAIQQRRLECLSLVLQWRGATLENGEVERVDLSATDEVSFCYLYHEGMTVGRLFVVGRQLKITSQFLQFVYISNTRVFIKCLFVCYFTWLNNLK